MRLAPNVSRGLLLCLRLGGVSALFVVTLSVLATAGHKRELGDFIAVQNKMLLSASFGSLGFYSVILFYSARSTRLTTWAIAQFARCLPIVMMVCIGAALVLEWVSPSIGVVPLALLGVSASISTVAPALPLGRGRMLEFTLVELSGGVAFLVSALLLIDYHLVGPLHLSVCYALSQSLKIPLYLIRAAHLGELSGRGARFRLVGLPSPALMRRFLGPSWSTGNLYALLYRGLFLLLQRRAGTIFADVAIAWTVFDRAQNLIQVVNTLVYREVAAAGSRSRELLAKLMVLYPIIAAVGLTALCLALSVWSDITNAEFDERALAIAPIFAVWGYRAILQNALLAQRQYASVTRDLVYLLSAGVTIVLLAEHIIPSWFALNIVITALLIISIAMLQRRHRGFDVGSKL